MLGEGALEGQVVWKRVLAAIEEIRRTDPADGEPRHWPRSGGAFLYRPRILKQTIETAIVISDCNHGSVIKYVTKWEKPHTVPRLK